ncbi:ABC transporter substrate-binding protein, partial [Microbacterium sp.]|uniref:ABC transporter substrate-binding protein n=1 Tax=Microbacterium sp. TaxID=51671 RepID=UPI003736B192
MRLLSRTRVIGIAAAAASALLLAGCAGGDTPAGSEGEAVDYGEISVQYSWIKNEEFAGEFYAYEKGYYEDAGFSDVVGISGPDTGVAKLLSGTVQVALSDAASVGAAVAEQDAPLKIIGATFQKNPFTILSLADGANIQTPQDLIGKKIGVQDSNASVFDL